MLLALVLALSAQANDVPGARALRINRTEQLSAGASVRIEHVTALRGQFSVWAQSEQLDLELTVRRERGPALEDDDTGGARNPWLRFPSEGLGERLSIEVRAKDPQASGAFELCIRELPETQATEQVELQAQAVLREALKLDDAGRRLEAAKAVTASIEACCELARTHESAGLHVALLQLGRRAVDWSDFESFSRATMARREAMRGLYPLTSEAWGEVQLTVCQALRSGGAAQAACEACEEALRLALICYPPGHVNIPIVRYTLAQSNASARNLERAAELFRQALSEAEAIAGFDELRLALFKSDFGALLNELGELPEALELQRAALASIERLCPPDHDLTLGVLNNLATVLNAMGENSRSLELHERRCAAMAARLPLDNIEYIHARGNRAVVRLALGDASRAASELEEVMASLERTPYIESDQSDQPTVNLAEAWIATGRAAEALERVEQQVERRARSSRSDASMSWRLRVTAAHALRALGRDAQALAAAEEALGFAERAFPFENPDLAETRQLVGALRVKTQARDGARELAEAAAQQTRAYFARCAALFTMHDAEHAQRHWSRLVSDGVTLLDATSSEERAADNERAVFELCEGARAIGTSLLRAWRARGASERENHEALRREALRAARAVASLAAQSIAPAQLDAAIEARRRAEEALREALADEPEAPALADAGAREWARTLAEGEALVAYWRLDQRALSAPLTAPREARLNAFVLRSDGRVRRFDLGELAPIAEACRAWRLAARDERGDLAACGARLRELLIDPLRAALDGATRWRVALDDELHLLALEALPLEENVLLGERVRVVTVGSAAHVGASARRARGLAPKLVALGGVDYESSSADESDNGGAEGVAPTSLRLAGLARPSFAPLWETQDEIDGVAELFERAHDSASNSASEGARAASVLLSERDATSANFLAALDGATHLHVATHGFFALESAQRPAGAERLAERSPLTLCGLALAGANDTSRRDGLLTADELALLDLRSCELVVLSACDTHVGVASAGQGVASFQKALHAAGAQFVITSLWKVDDAAARELMLAFYAGLWEERLDVAQALWRAKCKLRERRAPLRDWAGWVLSSQ